MSAWRWRPKAARAVVLASSVHALPAWVAQSLGALTPDVRVSPDPDAIVAEVRRARPELAILDAAGTESTTVVALLRTLKADAYTAVVPCVVLGRTEEGVAFLLDGADEFIGSDCTSAEAEARMEAAVRRSRRDLAAQPTTRLPAATGIESEISRRIATGEPFAACYADLDHFKEFNDRYGYHEGDRVIRMVARVLHDAAVGVAGTAAFVGHIGGDDFMMVVPLNQAARVCELALDVFDTLAPHQYSDADRRAGYYFGKDRRGLLHRVPLMTLSVGVATSERRRFRSAAEVSRLASEMKSFAKARPGSFFAVDRRGGEDGSTAAGPTRDTPNSAST